MIKKTNRQKLYKKFKKAFGIWAFMFMWIYIIIRSTQAFFTAITFGFDIRDIYNNNIYGSVGIKKKSLKHTYTNYKRHFR
jgi:hypothetical protein